MNHERKILVAKALVSPDLTRFQDIVDQIPHGVLDTVPARVLAELVTTIHQIEIREFLRGEAHISRLLNLPEGR